MGEGAGAVGVGGKKAEGVVVVGSEEVGSEEADVVTDSSISGADVGVIVDLEAGVLEEGDFGLGADEAIEGGSKDIAVVAAGDLGAVGVSRRVGVGALVVAVLDLGEEAEGVGDLVEHHRDKVALSGGVTSVEDGLGIGSALRNEEVLGKVDGNGRVDSVGVVVNDLSINDGELGESLVEGL